MTIYCQFSVKSLFQDIKFDMKNDAFKHWRQMIVGEHWSQACTENMMLKITLFKYISENYNRWQVQYNITE